MKYLESVRDQLQSLAFFFGISGMVMVIASTVILITSWPAEANKIPAGALVGIMALSVGLGIGLAALVGCIALATFITPLGLITQTETVCYIAVPVGESPPSEDSPKGEGYGDSNNSPDDPDNLDDQEQEPKAPPA